MGAAGASPVSRSKTQDPTRMHMAFAVENINEARSEPSKKSLKLQEFGGLVGEVSPTDLF